MTAISAAQTHPPLEAVQQMDTAAVRDALQFIEAFWPVLANVTAFKKKLQFTIRTKKTAVAANALQIYDVAKRLARRDPANVEMASHVADLKRDLGRRGRRPAAKTPPEVPIETT